MLVLLLLLYYYYYYYYIIGTQEIVIFREDLISKMRRHCIVPPNMKQDTSIYKHLVRTILDQSHVCPLPLHVSLMK